CFVHSAVSRFDEFITGKPRSQDSAVRLNSDVMAHVMQINADVYRRVVSADHLRQHADRLGEAVDDLTKRGTMCVLYEMPVDATLADLPLPTAHREAVRARFPKEKYHWLTFNRSHNYE